MGAGGKKGGQDEGGNRKKWRNRGRGGSEGLAEMRSGAAHRIVKALSLPTSVGIEPVMRRDRRILPRARTHARAARARERGE